MKYVYASSTSLCTINAHVHACIIIIIIIMFAIFFLQKRG